MNYYVVFYSQKECVNIIHCLMSQILLITSCVTKVALRALGFEVNKSEVLELMNEYDTSNSGYVDYKGFHDIGVFISN